MELLIAHLKAITLIVVYVVAFNSVRFWKPFRQFLQRRRQKRDAIIIVKPAKDKLSADDPRVRDILQLDGSS